MSTAPNRGLSAKLLPLGPECGVSTRLDVRRTFLIITLDLVAILLYSVQRTPYDLAHDYANFYGGGALVRDGRPHELYKPTAIQGIQKQVWPEAVGILFVRPPWYAAVFALFASMPYQAAHVIWIASQMLLLVLIWMWAATLFGLKAIERTSLYIPPIVGICGQDCVIPLAVLVSAYVFSKKNWLFCSGIVLGLGLFKFHLFALWGLVLLINRRWKMLAGFCISAAIELIASWWLVGPDGLRSYVHLLSSPDIFNPGSFKMISIWGLLINLGLNNQMIGFAFAVACVAFCLIGTWHADIDRLFVVIPITSLFAASHVFTYDATMLLLPIWLIFSGWNDNRVGTVTDWFSRPYAFVIMLFAPAPLAAIGSIGVACLFVAALQYKQNLLVTCSSSTSVQKSC